jgi:hypothetical protein|tara:strand:- start:269 stop:478 length:210 start_codon:yes stop_codon:yes gene_type:complete
MLCFPRLFAQTKPSAWPSANKKAFFCDFCNDLGTEKRRLAKRERHGKNLFFFVTAREKRHQRFAKKHDR